MPAKHKDYEWTKFSVATVKRAYENFLSHLPKEALRVRTIYSVRTVDADWSLDTEEEFFAEYRLDTTGTAAYQLLYRNQTGDENFSFDLNYWHTLDRKTGIQVRLPVRSSIEAVFSVLEDSGELGNVKPPPKPEPARAPDVPVTVFVGHGRSGEWHELVDHLRDKHGIHVEFFEAEPRAGMSNLDVVLEMGGEVDFAVLVHTAEDEVTDGTVRARQNVVHETGVFQALLGPHRAVIVRQEGCDDFSNVDGIQELRYSSQIREVFGELVAVLKREFPTLSVSPRPEYWRRFGWHRGR